MGNPFYLGVRFVDRGVTEHDYTAPVAGSATAFRLVAGKDDGGGFLAPGEQVGITSNHQSRAGASLNAGTRLDGQVGTGFHIDDAVKNPGGAGMPGLIAEQGAFDHLLAGNQLMKRLIGKVADHAEHHHGQPEPGVHPLRSCTATAGDGGAAQGFGYVRIGQWQRRAGGCRAFMQQHAVEVGGLQLQAKGANFFIVAVDCPADDFGPIDRVVEQRVEMHKA